MRDHFLIIYYTIYSSFLKQNRFGIKKTRSIINACANKEVVRMSTVTPNHILRAVFQCILMFNLDLSGVIEAGYEILINKSKR